MKSTIEQPATEPVVVMSRTLNAPRHVVWDVFTNPKHVAKWYGGHGFSSPVCEMDVRPGGKWKHVMRTPDGSEYKLEFVFVDVKKPELISWQDVDHGKKSHPTTRLNVVTFEEDGARTKWKLVSHFETTADRDAAVKFGFSNVIDQGTEKLEAIAQEML